MKRWELIVGLAFVLCAVYDLFRRDWLSGGAYLSLGASLFLGPNRPGAGRIPAIALGLVGIALIVARVALHGGSS